MRDFACICARFQGAAVEKVFAHPVMWMEDTLTDNLVVVGEALYSGKSRLLAVVYEETEHNIRIVTIHPIRASQYKMRLLKGRWKER